MNERESVIVVGVDGSDASKEALRWAARQAGLTGARLLAVRAWRKPPPFGYPVPPTGLTDEDVAGQARKELEAVIAEALGDGAPVPVSAQLVHGHPAPALISASKDASLLVVGSRGRGAFAGMLLGSVSAHCTQYASCPVVVVRE